MSKCSLQLSQAGVNADGHIEELLACFWEMTTGQQIELLKVKALHEIAFALRSVGTKSQGGFELLSVTHRDGLRSIAGRMDDAIAQIGDSVDGLTLALRGKLFAEELSKEGEAKRKRIAGSVHRIGEGGGT